MTRKNKQPLYPGQYRRSDIPHMIAILEETKPRLRAYKGHTPRICYLLGGVWPYYLRVRNMIMYSLNGSSTLDVWLGRPLSKRDAIRLRIQWIDKMIADLKRYQDG